MARKRKQPEQPATRLRTKVRPRPKVVIPYKPPFIPALPKAKPAGPVKPSINVEMTMQWIWSVGSPSDASAMLGDFECVTARIKQLGSKPNRKAVAKLDDAGLVPAYNGQGFVRWVRSTDKSDLPVLQKMFAAMRLRIRHANWLKRKR